MQEPCSVSIYETYSIDLRKTTDKAALGVDVTLAAALQRIVEVLIKAAVNCYVVKKLIFIKICLVRLSVVVPYNVYKLLEKSSFTRAHDFFWNQNVTLELFISVLYLICRLQKFTVRGTCLLMLYEYNFESYDKLWSFFCIE